MKKKFESAFSLIELSVVILIIGILIAGVAGGQILVQKSRVRTAQNLTKSSPVNTIENLVAWYETSMDSSFGGTFPKDGVSVATWYDSNPQRIDKNNGTQGTALNQPIFRENIINGLPTLRFTASSTQFFNLPNGTVPYNNSPYTIFFVSKTTGTTRPGLLGSGTYGSSSRANAFRYEGNNLVNYWWSNDITSTNSPITANKFQVISFYYDLSQRRIYVDQNLSRSSSASNNQSTELNNTIGKTNNSGEYMDGDIAEIIIFSRDLSYSDITLISNYLSKKYNIK